MAAKRKPQTAKAPAIEMSPDFVPLEVFNNELLTAPAKPKLTTVQKVRLVEEAIEEVRPFLQRDGGDCELIDIDGDKVLVKLTGACVHCQLASMTIGGVQERVVKKVGLPMRVIPVPAGGMH